MLRQFKMRMFEIRHKWSFLLGQLEFTKFKKNYVQQFVINVVNTGPNQQNGRFL